MNPLSPKQILRNLENGFFMTHQEQTEAAHLIRQLQESNQALSEGMIKYADEIVKLRRDLHNPTGFNVNVTEFENQIRTDQLKSILQAITDPENQPSQFGTVPVKYMEQQILQERKACIDIVIQNVSPAMARECEDAINARSLNDVI